MYINICRYVYASNLQFTCAFGSSFLFTVACVWDGVRSLQQSWDQKFEVHGHR